MQETSNIISYIFNPTFSGWFLIAKIIFIVFSLFFLGVIIFVLLRSKWLKYRLLEDLSEFLTYKPYGVRRMVKQWAKTTGRLATALESEYKLALIEADSIFDDILKRMGYAGTTLEERLEKLTSATLPNIDQIWEAHKIRNNIVHDPDYRLSLDEARKTLETYEQALRDLQAL